MQGNGEMLFSYSGLNTGSLVLGIGAVTTGARQRLAPTTDCAGLRKLGLTFAGAGLFLGAIGLEPFAVAYGVTGLGFGIAGEVCD